MFPAMYFSRVPRGTLWRNYKGRRWHNADRQRLFNGAEEIYGYRTEYYDCEGGCGCGMQRDEFVTFPAIHLDRPLSAEAIDRIIRDRYESEVDGWTYRW